MDVLHFKEELVQGSPMTFTMKAGWSTVFYENGSHIIFLLELTIFLEIIILHEWEGMMGYLYRYLYNHHGSSY